ncbi:MAG: hypothetical protein ACRD0P_17960 [Stackebrandtia sp.]
MEATVESLGVPVTELKMNTSAAGYLPDGTPVLYVQGGSPGNAVQFAVLDALTGEQLRHHAIEELDDSLSMMVAPDGKVYIPGWGPKSLLFRYDPVTDTMTNLGPAVAGESHITRLVAGEDGTLYGGTYPNGHVFSYDPATETFTDYGRIDPTEHYARAVAYDEAGHLYAGTEGTARVIRVDLTTGEKVDVPQPPTMKPSDYRISLMAWRDGLLFAYYGGSLEWHVYDPAAGAWVAHLPKAAPSMPTEVSVDGRVYFANTAENRLYYFDMATREYLPAGWDQPVNYYLGGGGMTLIDLKHPNYPGESIVGMGRRGEMWRFNPETGHGYVDLDPDMPETPVTVRAFGSGPDGKVYVGLSFNSGNLVTFDPATEEMSVRRTGALSSQIHQYLVEDGIVYMGTYTGAVLRSYDPAQPLATGNPGTVFNLNEYNQDRIFGLTAAGDRIAAGSLGKRGHPSGRLVFYTPSTKDVQDFGEILHGHQLIAMATVGDTLYIGTSINTPGADPIAEAARILAWNLTTDTISWQTAPVPGLDTISAMVPREDGRLWALTTDGTAFLFNPRTRKVEQTVRISDPGGAHGYPKLSEGPDGMLYGSTGTGAIFVLNPWSGDHCALASGHYVLPHSDGKLYFSRGPEVFRATLTRPAAPEKATG